MFLFLLFLPIRLAKRSNRIIPLLLKLISVMCQTIKKYANVIGTSSNADVRNVAWRYLGKLAENKRIWNFAIVWNLLDCELQAPTPTVSFRVALSILAWMLRTSESELNRNNPTSNKVRQNYLSKFRDPWLEQ
jgi:hypothetical protein